MKRQIGIEELQPAEVAVLKVIWHECQTDPHGGLTVEEIGERLGHGTTDGAYTAIRSLLDRQKRRPKWQILLPVLGSRKGKQGRIPRAYRIVQRGMADWPITAFLLMELSYFDKLNPRIDAKEFREHLIKHCGYLDTIETPGIRGTPISKDEVRERIEYACTWDYMERIPPKTDYHTVMATDRTISEMKFLKFVADHYPEEIQKQGRQVAFSYYQQVRNLEHKKD